MKIKATHTVIYDTEDKEFRAEFLEWSDDYPMTLKSLKSFIIDRFINPNFDKGETKIRIQIGDV